MLLLSLFHEVSIVTGVPGAFRATAGKEYLYTQSEHQIPFRSSFFVQSKFFRDRILYLHHLLRAYLGVDNKG